MLNCLFFLPLQLCFSMHCLRFRFCSLDVSNYKSLCIVRKVLKIFEKSDLFRVIKKMLKTLSLK